MKMKTKTKKIFVLIISTIICANLFGISLEETSQQIHNSINTLKTEIKDLKSELGKMEVLNSQQLTDIQKLQEEKNQLNSALDDTVIKLEEYSTKITELTLKLKTRGKIVLTLGIILVVMIIIKIIVMILKVKCNINLPYWLNCLL